MDISQLNLKRYPFIKGQDLQAWDASDELILSSLPEDIRDKKILIIGDSFGALTISLQSYNPDSYNDSYVSHKGTLVNSNNDINLISDLDELKDSYNLIIIKIPKSMSFFEDILINLTNIIEKQAHFICGGMVKHTPKSAYDLLQKYIGETSTSLAKKKARVIFSKFQKDIAPNIYPKSVFVPEMASDFINHSNIFSKAKLDIGTRFFLEHIPTENFNSILDLGCANGIVGIKAKKLNSDANIFFSDESFMAIKSARVNYSNHFDDKAEFFWTNCYEDTDFPTVDLVLCNPPFHQGNTIGDFIAWQMFKDAKKALNPGGLIRVIGNSHLGYHTKLKKIFGNSKIIAQNKKFIIVDSYKT